MSMSSIKVYLVIVTILLLIAIGFGVYVWYRIQTLELEPQEVTAPGAVGDEETQKEIRQQQSNE